MTGVPADLTGLFTAANVRGWLHARDLDSGTEIGHDPDSPVVLASVFKIPVLLELVRQDAAGLLDASAPMLLPAGERTPGPFGISVMRDPIQMSLRDLAWLMMGISDNAATDVICDRVGIAAVNRLLQELGLDQTVLVGTCRELFATMAEDLGTDLAGLAGLDLADPSVVDRLRVLDPRVTSRSTARQTTELLAQVWTDKAAAAQVCAEVRRTLGMQVWPHRLAAGFPEDDIRTSGKTGTVPRWRNEAGVVEYPDGGRYAVAVFTRSAVTRTKNPVADAVIGAAARHAVDALRAIAPMEVSGQPSPSLTP